jgi:hypothetical protein
LGENRWGEQRMEGYEFYWCDAIEGPHLIGILPERRKNPERITEESVMNWGRIILGESIDLSNLSFVRVTNNENGMESPTPSHLSEPSDRVKE